METHSSLLAWKISWTGESGGLQSMGSQSRTRLSKHTHTHTHTHTRTHAHTLGHTHTRPPPLHPYVPCTSLSLILWGLVESSVSDDFGERLSYLCSL